MGDVDTVLTPALPLRVSRSPPKLKWFAIKTAVYCATLQATTGWHLSVLSGDMAMIEEQFNMSSFSKGMLGSACLLGSLLVGFFAGQWVDLLGRRPSTIVYCSVGLIFTLAQLFCNEVISLTIMRVLIGATLSLWYAVVPCVCSETSPSGSRGKIISSVETCWYVGSILSILSGYVTHQLKASWKWPLLLPAIPLGIGLVLGFLWLPETPAWLIQKNRLDEARHVALVYTNTLVLLDEADSRDDLHLPSSAVPFSSSREILLSQDASPSFAQLSNDFARTDLSVSSPRSHFCGWSLLFASGQRTRTIYGALFWGCLVVPTFAIATFALEILEMLQIDDPYAGNLIVSCFSLIGAASCILLIEKIGRRFVAISQFWVTCAALCFIGIWPSGPAVLLFILFAIYQFSNAFGAPLTVAYQAELFPTEIRATGSGFISAASRVFAICGTFAMPFLLDRWGVGPALILAGVVAGLGAVVSHIWAPETTGLTLAQFSHQHAPSQTTMPAAKPTKGRSLFSGSVHLDVAMSEPASPSTVLPATPS